MARTVQEELGGTLMDVKIALYGGTQQVYLYPEKDGLTVKIHEMTPKTHKIIRRPEEEKQFDWEAVLEALNIHVEMITKDTHLWGRVLGK
jgi:hypothetical protein